MKSLAIIPVYRERGKIGKVLERFEDGYVDEICLVLDDPEPVILREIEDSRETLRTPIVTIRNQERKGIGYAIKQGYDYALSHGYDLIVVMAGNGKDDPKEIPRMTKPILEDGFEYVQGSRFLPGAHHEKNPILRGIFSRLFPFLWTWATGVRCTDVTNGFRAYTTSLLKDPRIDVWQDWLDRYELEYYVHYKALTLGYGFTERPISKTYPYRNRGGYSHIIPTRDWWQIVGPLILLRVGARD